MYCKKVSYSFFRNIEKQTIEFSDGVNILYGNNAEGKTNALEGIYLFANGKSFRSGGEKELINFNSNYADLTLFYEDNNRTNKMEMRLNRESRKICKRNGVDIKKMAEFVGYFRSVLFCPEHLSIIKDGPQERRSFLDGAISQLKPIYLASLQKYNTILAQRNSLIKNYEEDKESFNKTIELWSAYLAREAALIAMERSEYVKELNKSVGDFFTDMTNAREQTSLQYNCGKTESEYYALLTQNLEKELAAGNTLYGIHKDDINIYLNGKEARIFGSQGQQRCLALAMKMGEGEISKKETGDYPVFLFDDILSELDQKRKNYVINGIKDRQVIITCCEKDCFDEITSSVTYVENGTYERK